MARYRKIDPRIHNDSKFCSLSLEGRYLFMFVLTHPNMTALGAFRTTKESLISELKGLGEGFGKGFDELVEKGMVKYDEKACLLFATNFIKYNPPENPNVVKGWISALDLLPECPLLLKVLESASATANALFTGAKKGFDNPLESIIETLSKEFPQPFEKSLAKSMPNQEQEQEQKYISSSVTDVTSEDSTPRAKMPSGGNKARTYKLDVEALPDEWRAYCEQTRPDLDPDVVFMAFRSCFTSGSKAGTMRSEKGWNQSWFNWVRNEREPRNTYQTSRQPARKSEKEPNWAELDYGTIGAI